MYLDSVIGKQEMERRDMQRFTHWDRTSKGNVRGETYKKYFKPIAVGNFATMEIFAERSFDTANVGYRVSLPKFLYDNNVQELVPNDLERAAVRIANLVEYHTGIPFDVMNARLARADITHNFRMTQDEVNRRLAASKGVRFGGNHTRIIDKEKGVPSVYVGRPEYNERYLYSKHAETAVRLKGQKANDEHLRDSIGILRLENARYAPKLKKDAEQLGIKQITLETFLDPHFAEAILKQDMQKFCLDRAIVGCDDRQTQLEVYCGNDSAKWARLWGFLCRVMERGEKEAFAFFGYPYARRAKLELIDAGVWLAEENRIELPALAAPKFEGLVIDAEAIRGFRSNTSHQFAPVQTFIS